MGADGMRVNQNSRWELLFLSYKIKLLGASYPTVNKIARTLRRLVIQHVDENIVSRDHVLSKCTLDRD